MIVFVYDSHSNVLYSFHHLSESPDPIYRMTYRKQENSHVGHVFGRTATTQRIFLHHSAFTSSDKASVMAVMMNPGAMALARMPRDPSSCATDWPKQSYRLWKRHSWPGLHCREDTYHRGHVYDAAGFLAHHDRRCRHG